jgi:hypothetical protein
VGQVAIDGIGYRRRVDLPVLGAPLDVGERTRGMPLLVVISRWRMRNWLTKAGLRPVCLSKPAGVVLEPRGGQIDLGVTVPAAITDVLAAAVVIDGASLSVLLAAEGSGAKARDVRAELVDVAATLIPLILVADLAELAALLLFLIVIVVLLLGLCASNANQAE